MKKLAYLLTPLLTLGLLGVSTPSQTQEETPGVSRRPAETRRVATRSHWRRGPMERMKSELGLSDDQVTKIEGIFRDAQKKSIKMRADLRVARIELGELVAQDKVDRDRVNAKVDQIGQLSSQRLRLQTDVVLATRDVLNTEQRVKAERWLNRFLGGDGHRRRHRR